MSEQSPTEPRQTLSISDDASVESSQIGGQAGRDATIAQNQGSGHIFQGVTFNLFGRHQGTQATGLTRQEYRNRQVLLNKVQNYWIKGVLEKSLHDQVAIALGLETRADAVASPWNIALETGEQTPQLLPLGTSVISIFDELGSGRTLLILGKPGSGKTITLLQLARDLIRSAQQDIEYLIPIVFNLSSWNGKQTIAEWLVEELNTKYQVPKSIGQPWIKQQQLLLLLDGLDEVRTENRDTCVAALNAFQQEYATEMVVCSRIQDYQVLSNRLNFQRAIYLKPLTPVQIYCYLDSLNADLTGLRTLLVKDTALQELVQSPLILNIAVFAYEGVTTEDLPKTHIVEEHRQQLFDTYIERMLKHRGAEKRYSKAQTVRWLSWLAQQLKCSSQTIFLIERIHYDWLQTPKQQWMYTLVSSLMLGLAEGLILLLSFGLKNRLSLVLLSWAIFSLINVLMVGLRFFVIGMSNQPFKSVLEKGVNSLYTAFSFGLFSGFAAGISSTVKGGLIVGLINGLLSGLMDWFIGGTTVLRFIQPVEALKWSWVNIKKSLILWLTSQAALGMMLGLIEELGIGLSRGLVIGLVGGMIWGVLMGLSSGSEIETKVIPNQGVWRSAKIATVIALIGSLGLFPIAKLLSAPVPLGVIYGLTVGLLMGGTACIVHFSLRIVFCCNGYMPWNYARFLNYATERIFLQKVGGGYIFIHRLVLEHFAQMRLSVGAQLKSTSLLH